MPRAELLEIARRELAGVGDAVLGEWQELEGGIAVHLRRRLTAEEAESVGPVVDVRGTWEAAKRIAKMRRFLPPEFARVPDAMLP